VESIAVAAVAFDSGIGVGIRMLMVWDLRGIANDETIGKLGGCALQQVSGTGYVGVGVG
jgi:hypothetical protein